MEAEGATAVVTNLEDGWVRKTIKRSHRGKGMPLAKIYELQEWAHNLLGHGEFQLLFTPAVRDLTKTSYEMEKIVPEVIYTVKNDTDLARELTRFLAHALKNGIVPQDFELYQQPDGRVALLDFDKFGTVEGDKALFWYGEMPLKEGLSQAVLTEDIVNTALALKVGGGRRRTKQRKTRRTRKTRKTLSTL